MAMTRDDVIRLAVDAGLGRHLPAIADLPGCWWGAADLELLERFAGLVAAAEREACAKACEDAINSISEEYVIGEERREAGINACTNLAKRIRARGGE